ncbi:MULTISPECIES: tautomerase family protein [Rhizobium]|uniref:4-oxalocrotonate tautomerase n=1 Tax=Rhizobium miluonense TaxID=411945 RepID=A0A1C3WHK6_9HYPH|nr:4-oxalocrotonate tautomerase family protein [Rhizobium miluonense]SCB39543.1 4-oxalocrotonate tautomerase [Rhizobium miluonense]
MPFVTVKLTREGTEPGVDRTTAAQKAEIYKGISQVLFDVLGKPPEWTWVVVEEVEMEDWGWGGMPVAEYRNKLAAQGSASKKLHEDGTSN